MFSTNVCERTVRSLRAAGWRVSVSPCWARISNTEGCGRSASGKAEVRNAEVAITRDGELMTATER